MTKLALAIIFVVAVCQGQTPPSAAAPIPPTDADCNVVLHEFQRQSSLSGAAAAWLKVCRAVLQDDDRENRVQTIEKDLNRGKFDKTPAGRVKQLEADAVTRGQQLEAAKKRLDDLDRSTGLTKSDVRRIWVLTAAVLVFFMQAGFKCLEVGMSRSEHSGGTALLNLSNWLILCLVYWCIGFAFMFGDWTTMNSTHLFFPAAADFTAFGRTLGFEFFLFQLAFAATAATIVDGALAERVSMPAYFLVAVATGALIYPVFGHWAWGGAVDSTGQGWLAAWGFKDFAGSTVVHSVGAWIAWVGIVFVGPRRYRFGEGQKPLRPFNLGYAVLGVIMLWFGWWGFNGGSLSRFNDPDFFGRVASVILHTNVAGAAAGLTSYLFAVAIGRKSVFEKMIGGTLGGLVAITASCDTVHPAGAIVIGVGAGFLHNLAYDLLIKLKHDDVAGAVPVHGFCGVWGTLCAAFGTGKPWAEQLPIQVVGIVTAIGWTVAISIAVFWLLERVLGLRTSIRGEDAGDEVTSQLA